MTNKKIWILLLLVFIIGGGLGFLIGRSKKVTEIKYVTKYVSGPSVSESKVDIKPIKEVIPKIKFLGSDTLIVNKVDTIKEFMSKDTLDIITDWFTKRTYSELMFDNDSLGKLIINAEVEKNSLNELGYNYYPKYKFTEITKYEKDMFSPYITIGYSTANIGNLQFGLIINNFVISYQGSYQFNSDQSNQFYHGLNIGYKF